MKSCFLKGNLEVEDKNKKAFSAAFWYILSSFISKALLYIFTPLYTRLLTNSEYGMYSNFLSWQNILVALLTFDLASAISIAYYDYDENDFRGFVSTITLFSYIIPGFFCVFIYIFRNRFGNFFSIDSRYIPLLLAYITFNNTLNIFQVEQRVQLKYKLSSLITLGASAITVIATIVFALTFSDKLFGVLLGGVIINLIISSVLSITIIRKSKKIKFSFLKYALFLAVPLVPHVLAGTILGSSDKVMITKYCGYDMNAFYSLAYTVSMLITMIASSANKAWMPWLFEKLKDDNYQGIKKVSIYIIVGISLLSLFLCLFAPEVLYIFGGESYAEAIYVMPPLIVSCLINCVGTFYINLEFYCKKTGWISFSTIICAGINILLNLFFIKEFGYIAAAYTTLFSSLLNLMFHLVIVYKLKYSNIFNNRVLILITLFASLLCESVLILYKSTVLRYVFVGIITLIIVFILVKNKRQFYQILHSILPRRGGNKND